MRLGERVGYVVERLNGGRDVGPIAETLDNFRVAEEGGDDEDVKGGARCAGEETVRDETAESRVRDGEEGEDLVEDLVREGGEIEVLHLD